jgi:general secretion pathway protein K
MTRRHRRTAPGGDHQRGAALITALLVAALAAVMVSGMLWQQWSMISREQAAREAAQARWLLRGALDWSRLILREAQATSQVTYLGQPWSVPLADASLGTFLAAGRGAGSDLADTWLEGRIIDAQSKFNLFNLAPQGKPVDDAVQTLQRLEALLGIAPAVGDAIVQGIAAANAGAMSNSADAPLPLRTLSDLARLSPEVAKALPKLQPYVTLLPLATPVNANTAPAPVLAAVLDVAPDAAARLVQARTQKYFDSVSAVNQSLGPTGSSSKPDISVNSSFFEAIARIRIGHFEYAERALLQRVGQGVQLLRVERVPPWTARPPS